ncbi:transposase [Aquisphaera insulae]|uniref:transposase n=1 Tax=Aquisphaera insulae TaxID=2712864 RepID=UPI00203052A1|nr:transposase [Aquisphaera insulae]
MPSSYSWSLPGARKLVPHEAPQGRRINALAAYRLYGPPRLEAFTAGRTWDSYDLLAFLRALPPARVPRVVVLDNASFHTSDVVRRARPSLARSGLYLYYLPAYAPELNRIEAIFRQIKHHGMPVRSYETKVELQRAVEDAFSDYAVSLHSRRRRKPRPAA